MQPSPFVLDGSRRTDDDGIGGQTAIELMTGQRQDGDSTGTGDRTTIGPGLVLVTKRQRNRLGMRIGRNWMNWTGKFIATYDVLKFSSVKRTKSSSSLEVK